MANNRGGGSKDIINRIANSIKASESKNQLSMQRMFSDMGKRFLEQNAGGSYPNINTSASQAFGVRANQPNIFQVASGMSADRMSQQDRLSQMQSSLSAQRNSIMEAQKASMREIRDRSLPQSFRYQTAREALSSSLFTDPKDILRAQHQVRSYEHRDSVRERNESLRNLRNQYNSASLISDPQKRIDSLEGIISGASQYAGRDNRLIVEAQKQKERLQSQIERRAKEESISREFSTIRGGSGSRSDKILELKGLAERGEGTSVLKSIEREIKELVRLGNKEDKDRKRNEEQFTKAQNKVVSQNPFLSSIMDKSTPQGLRNISRMGAISNALGAVGGALLGAGTDFYRTGVSLPREAYGAYADVQANAANRFLRSSTDFSGRGLLDRYGDILIGGQSQDRLFLGMSGRQRSEAAARGEINRARNLGLLEAGTSVGTSLLKGGAKIIGGAGIVASAAGGTIASAGLATPVTGAIGAAGFGIAASGVSDVIGGIRSAFGNQAVQATGALGKDRQVRALNQYESQVKDLSESQILANLEASAVRGASLDDAMRARSAAQAGISLIGSRGVSSMSQLQALNDRANFIPGVTGPAGSDFEVSSRRLKRAENLLRGGAGGALSVGANLGFSVDEFDLMRAQAQNAGGVGAGPDNSGLRTQRLVQMSRSGRGSFEQLLGNVTAISKISGTGGNEQLLERIMSNAVASGFDKSRTAQEFVQTTTGIASSMGLTNVGGVSRQIGAISSLAGTGERGLSEAARGFQSIEGIRNNVLSRSLESVNLSKLGVKYGTGAVDQLGVLSVAKQQDVLKELQAAGGDYAKLKSIEAKSIFTALKPEQVSAFAKDAFQTGGGYAGMLAGANLNVDDLRKDISNIISTNGGGKTKKQRSEIERQILGKLQPVAVMQGFEASQLMNIATGLGIPGLDKIMSNKGGAVDTEAIARFDKMNSFNVQRAISQTSRAAMGTDMLSSTLLKDLLNARDPTGFSARSAQSDKKAIISKSSIGDLFAQGMGLSSGLGKEREQLLLSTKFSEVTKRAEDIQGYLQSGGKAENILSKFGDNEITKLAQSLNQTKEEAIINTEKDERNRAGLQYNEIEIGQRSITLMATAIKDSMKKFKTEVNKNEND